MAETGLAVSFTGVRRPFELREFPVPEPAPGAVLVKVLMANVCGSDMHIWRGEYDVSRGEPEPYSRAIGHEMTGTVHRLGDGVTADSAGRPLAVGETGEIAVRSRYLALGYWRRPDLTEASFRPDPAEGSARVYRTGDVGRLRPDGCLEFLGRKDFRLKVRGHRVDPGEVESALLGLEGVREAVVATSEDARGEARLVAYVLPEEPHLDPDALRRALVETLPEHLIPTRFVELEAFPLDANGKVDRRRLAAPEVPPRRHPRIAPRDPLEDRLALLFEQVLGVEEVGVDESFFDLGGDSLAAAEILARLAAETGQRLPVSSLLIAPSVERLAKLVTGAERETSSRILVPIQPEGGEPPLFLVHDGAGEVLRYAALARHLGDDQPVFGLQAAISAVGIPALAGRYLAELRRVQPTGPYRLGGWCFGGVVAFEMAHQLREGGEEVALLALLGISAFDFPALVTRAAWRRYRRSGGDGLLPRVGFHLGRARGMAARDAAVYLMWRSLRVAPYVYKRAARRPPTVGWSAFRWYTPGSYPGHAVLLLSEEETAAYSRDPSVDFAGLATEGVDVRQFPVGHDALLAEPNVRAVAAELHLLLQAASRDGVDASPGADAGARRDRPPARAHRGT